MSDICVPEVTRVGCNWASTALAIRQWIRVTSFGPLKKFPWLNRCVQVEQRGTAVVKLAGITTSMKEYSLQIRSIAGKIWIGRKRWVIRGVSEGSGVENISWLNCGHCNAG